MGPTQRRIFGLFWLVLAVSASAIPVSASAAESASYRLLPGTAESRPNQSLSSPSYSLRERTPSLGAVSLVSLTYRIVSALPPRFILPDHPPPEVVTGWSDAAGTVRNMAGMRQAMQARMAAQRTASPQPGAPGPSVQAPPPVQALPAQVPPGQTPATAIPGIPILPTLPRDEQRTPTQKPELHFAPEIQRKEQRLEQRKQEVKSSEEKRAEQRKIVEKRIEQRRELRTSVPSPQKSQSPAAVQPRSSARVGMRIGARLSSLLLGSSTESPFAAVAVTSLISFALMFFLLLRRRKC